MQAELMMLADSAFPSGAHGHSQGLEYAIQRGWVTDAYSLEAWGRDAIVFGIAICDGRALIQASQINPRSTEGRAGLFALNAELSALRPGQLQRQAMAQMGRSFLRSARDAWPQKLADFLPPDFLNNQVGPASDFVQYPLAWALVCRALEINIQTAWLAYLIAATRQMVQVALRIMNFGQREALSVQAKLTSLIQGLPFNLERELGARLESAAFRLDMAGLGHGSLDRHYFRS